MASKKFTILLLPEGSDKVRKITAPEKLIFTLAALILLIVLVMGWIINDYSKVKTQMPELQYLKKENKTQKTHLISLTKKIEQINQQMAELQEFDYKLKVMANIVQPSGDQDQFLGVGGSDVTSFNPDYRSEVANKSLIQKMHKSLENLETEIAVSSISQIELSNFLKKQKSLLASTPSIKPTEGWLSSGFGYRISPFTNQREFHKGLDIATRIGTPVIAPADGLVVFIGREGHLGRTIAINHGYNIVTRYGHLSNFKVEKGEHVKRAQVIGEVGNSGRCTGPHLHYEVHLNSIPVNPLQYILN
jgi:murein DD-endopeptidase MepM/ murein hydrolase activator NlpD